MNQFKPYPGYFVPAPRHGQPELCGLYYTIRHGGQLKKHYLPQVAVEVHASILSSTSRTVLTQTFTNPAEDRGIREVRYAFPLYDGVSVVGFTCRIGDRVIVGEVKEKEKARAVYQDAVSRGETAGLFEQLPDASDVFITTVGNVPPGAKIVITVTYLGELKHDMEVDGIRFTIPTIICPRYGGYFQVPVYADASAVGKGISITIDAEVAEGSFIQKILSPTHPIAVSMGTTSLAPNSTPSMTKASATLSLGQAQLDTDFVLQLVTKDAGVPKAILENHPTIPNQRALMATVVPKFALPSERPEVVFVCDRSGSMAGTRLDLVIQALRVLLKSLPLGVKFNICSFGSSASFLWPKSVTYSQQTLDEGNRHIESFRADYGGTEMIRPLKATIDQRYKDIPLEVILLTDGEVWNQNELFSFLNQEITEKKAPIRIFTLGIGSGVSHSLVEGVARAGNGFCQTVGEGEKMDAKMVRMLKGALSPHVNDYSLDVKYSAETDGAATDNDFEVVEKVADALAVQLDLSDKEREQLPKKTISLFDESADPDKDIAPPNDGSGESKYAHLPQIAVPKIIQAPEQIPPLFPFTRTTIYLLLGPESPQTTPKSVILRATSAHGPLELEIPVQALKTTGETIHQLAAKKAIAELEEGRGWVPEAKDKSDGKPIKEKYESRYQDMVEREAVRLGVQFQVGGKWCSFVAVEKREKKADEDMSDDWEWLGEAHPALPYQEDSKRQREGRYLSMPMALAASSSAVSSQFFGGMPSSRSLPSSSSQGGDEKKKRSLGSGVFSARRMAQPKSSSVGTSFQSQGLDRNQTQPAPQGAGPHALQDYQTQLLILEQQNKERRRMAQELQIAQQQMQQQGQDSGSALMMQGQMFGRPQAASPMTNSSRTRGLPYGQSGLFGREQPQPQMQMQQQTHLHAYPASHQHGELPPLQSVAQQQQAQGGISAGTTKSSDPLHTLHELIALQTFEGYWLKSPQLFVLLGVSEADADKIIKDVALNEEFVITALVVAFFERKLADQSHVWELVVGKARRWLFENLDEMHTAKVDERVGLLV